MRRGWATAAFLFLAVSLFFYDFSVYAKATRRQAGAVKKVRKAGLNPVKNKKTEKSSSGVQDKDSATNKKDGSRHLGGGKKRAAATSGGGSGSSTSTKRAAVGSKRAASNGGKSARFSRSSRFAGLVKSAGSGEAKLTGNPCPVDKLVGYDSAAQTYYSKKDVACDAPEHTEFVMEMFLVGWQNIIRKQKRII